MEIVTAREANAGLGPEHISVANLAIIVLIRDFFPDVLGPLCATFDIKARWALSLPAGAVAHVSAPEMELFTAVERGPRRHLQAESGQTPANRTLVGEPIAYLKLLLL